MAAVIKIDPAPLVGDMMRNLSRHDADIASLHVELEELRMSLENVMVALGIHERRVTDLEKDRHAPPRERI